jgi:hypothetical protein
MRRSSFQLALIVMSAEVNEGLEAKRVIAPAFPLD